MSYHVEIARPAQIEIKALPGHVRGQARQLITSLRETPRPSRAKQLRDKPNIYRLWLASRWRIAYLVERGLETCARIASSPERDYRLRNAVKIRTRSDCR